MVFEALVWVDDSRWSPESEGPYIQDKQGVTLKGRLKSQVNTGHLIITQVFAREGLTTDHNLPFPGSPSTSCLPQNWTYPSCNLLYRSRNWTFRYL
jgi:hypothetical protein